MQQIAKGINFSETNKGNESFVVRIFTRSLQVRNPE